MDNFLSQLLGTISISDYMAGFVFALIGAIISLRLEARNRDKDSPNTPAQFKWSFMLQDNAQRLFTGFLITFICFRLAPQLLKQEFSMLLAFTVGACNDQVGGLIDKLQLLARKK